MAEKKQTTTQKPQQPAAPAPQNGGGLARKQQPTGAVLLANLIAEKAPAFAAVAAKHYDVDRLVKLAQAALSRNPKLATCTASSVLLCLVRCAELGLEPDSALPQKRMWLVPRWNKHIKVPGTEKKGANECTYIIDYRAQLDLARQSGLVTNIDAIEVCEKDKRSAMRFSSEGDAIRKFDIEIDPFSDRGAIIGYLAAARMASGEVRSVAMSKKQAEGHRDRFAGKYDGQVVGPWKSDFDAMAIKTALRKLWNLLPAGETAPARRLQELEREQERLEEQGRPLLPTPADKALLGSIPGEPDTTADEVAQALGAAADLADEIEQQQDGDPSPPELPEGEEAPDGQ